MAPGRRRTQPQVGLRRIDAALDALSAFGFSKGLITKTIKQLLEVYGGDQGWRFIEEERYQVVIDNILDKQNELEQQHQEGEDHTQPQDEVDEHNGDGTGVTENSMAVNKSDCLGESSQASESMVESERQQTERAPEICYRPRRPPCYGWISEDEDDDMETVQIVLNTGNNQQERRRKKSRWDVKPANMC